MTDLPLALVLTSANLLCTAAGLFFYARARKLLKSVSGRSWMRLELAVTDLQSQCTLLSEAQKRLQSRYAMRELRERRRSTGEDEEPSAPNGSDREKLRELARSKGLMR